MRVFTDILSKQVSYINNLPFRVHAQLNPNKATNEMDLGVYLNWKETNQVTFTE